MKWASAVSDDMDLASAAVECAGQIHAELEPGTIDLAIVFISPHHAAMYDEVPKLISNLLAPAVFLGCSAGGVIGGGREVENRPGFSVTAATLPGVDLTPFHLESGELPDLDSSPTAWEELVGVEAATTPHFIVLPDPFTFHAENFITGLDYAFPLSAKVGGLASGASQPGDNVLYLDDEIFRTGAIGLAMCGNIRVETIVAQGCRPIGSPMEITRSHQNLLLEVDGKPPLEALQELFNTLAARDRELFNTSLFMGILMDEFKEQCRPGDFLIRNIIGLDRNVGTLAIGAVLHEKQIVQFHLRDALTSTEDLQRQLARHADQSSEVGAGKPFGGLLFSCLGRGMYLYGEADHDTNLFKDFLGNIPLGGFFCNGEIGPVSGTTYLHGYTSSFGLFKPL